MDALKIGCFEEVIEDMENGTYDFTKNGQCCGCGSCCSNLLPVTESEIRSIKRYMKKHNIKECKHILPPMDVRFDLTCPFLDTTKSKDKCTIYPVRPAVCKSFICDPKQRKQFNATGKEFIVDVRETFFGGR